MAGAQHGWRAAWLARGMAGARHKVAARACKLESTRSAPSDATRGAKNRGGNRVLPLAKVALTDGYL